MRAYLLIFLVGIAVTYISVPFVRKFAVKTGAVTAVRKRDVHSVPTPRMGGLSMFFGIVSATLFAWATPFFNRIFSNNYQVWGVLLACLLICLLGIADDIFDLDWMLKLVGQVLVGVVAVFSGIQVISLPIFGLVVGSSFASMVFTVLLIVAVMNAVNFFDGLDGLLAGVVAIGSFAFFLYSYMISLTYFSYANFASFLAIATAGACVGFLPFNFHPAKIFMGDTGSMLLGFLISCSTIIVTGTINPVSTSIGTLPAFIPILFPILVLLFPILDMCMAVTRRVLHGKSPFSPDKLHLHHKMLRFGHTVTESVSLFYAWTALFSSMALLLLLFDSTIVLAFAIAAFIVLAFFTFRRSIFILLLSQEGILSALKHTEPRDLEEIINNPGDPLDEVAKVVDKNFKALSDK